MAKKTVDETVETATKKSAAKAPKKGAAKAAPKKAAKAPKAEKAAKKAAKAPKAAKKGAAKAAPKAEDAGAIHHKDIFPHVGKLGGSDAMKAFKASGSSEDLAHVLHHAAKTFAGVKGSKAKVAEAIAHLQKIAGGKKK